VTLVFYTRLQCRPFNRASHIWGAHCDEQGEVEVCFDLYVAALIRLGENEVIISKEIMRLNHYVTCVIRLILLDIFVYRTTYTTWIAQVTNTPCNAYQSLDLEIFP
jgi:hypothetical protein